MILSIAIPVPLRRSFDYLPPETFSPDQLNQLTPGMRVIAPFGNQEVVGILIDIRNSGQQSSGHKLRPIFKVIDESALLPAEVLSLCYWTSRYYQHPLGEVLHTALPALLRQIDTPPIKGETGWELTPEGKGLPENALKRAPEQAKLFTALLQTGAITRSQLKQSGYRTTTVKGLLNKGLIREIDIKPEPIVFSPENLNKPSYQLNPEQHDVLQKIRYDRFNACLLEGTTGSGKTEIYLQAIEQVLLSGNNALVLVPEIGLTPQTIGRFSARFQVRIAALHSKLNNNERLHAWEAARTGVANIIIGTRSAIFTPIPRLGIIIVDEEHDLSFKQQDGLRYSARDAAVVRAKHLHIPLILGSATPSLETYHNAITSRYTHLQLKHRAGGARQPQIHLLDIRGAKLEEGLSPQLLTEIKLTLAQNNQVLVFINRRGFAPALMCHHCGWVASCPRCDARLTVHQHPAHLHCHHCDYQRSLIYQCPACHSEELENMGYGTERTESFLKSHFPETPVYRIDRDTTRRKNALTDVFKQVHQGEACILVGTQMLAKGHHFANVTLVAVLDIDGGLMSTDFRGPERMGQLLVQVAGRAGREGKTGKVIVQSHYCQHPLLQVLIYQGFKPFALNLLNERRQAYLPPFGYLALIKAESKRPENAIEFLEAARKLAEQQINPSSPLQLLGPLPAIMEKRNDRFRYVIQISAHHRQLIQQLLNTLCPQLENHPLSRRTRWSVDIDPQDMS